ncbi:MAG: GYD domain-containing protein [Deltaproteobacteria bacterium]|nr:GYD domain-containing protein [Deltaproteobacteria bacterium]
MATYLMLFRFTPKGFEHIKESPARIEALKPQFRKANAEIKASYGLMGQYDTALVVEAPNDETIARLSMMIGQAGNVTCETHRAFGEEEFRRIVSAV